MCENNIIAENMLTTLMSFLKKKATSTNYDNVDHGYMICPNGHIRLRS